MVKKLMKVILFVSLLCTLLCGVSGASSFCTGKATGDWCAADGKSYVSCGYSDALRPCQIGLVCKHLTAGQPGVICDWPPVNNGPATPAPTDLPECSDEPEQTPTTAPVVTRAPVVTPAPTKAPTAAATATRAPPSTAPTSRPTTTTTSTTGVTTVPSTGSWPNGPVKAMYIDNFCYDPSFKFTSLIDDGYNLVVLAFMVSGVKWDCVTRWGELSAAEQKSQIDYAHSKGARIIASAGGATDVPFATFSGTKYGTDVATWAKANNLDGVDFDLENFGSDFTYGTLNHDAMVQWVVDASVAARNILGSTGVITHAPQTPYFGQHGWSNGYNEVWKKANGAIDFLMVQFYNNGDATTYESIFNSLSNQIMPTVRVINEQCGIPLNKIIVGKPANKADSGIQGYNTAAQLNAMFKQAKAEMGWNGGVMGWQFLTHAENQAWINGIYA